VRYFQALVWSLFHLAIRIDPFLRIFGAFVCILRGIARIDFLGLGDRPVCISVVRVLGVLTSLIRVDWRALAVSINLLTSHVVAIIMRSHILLRV
jgi:hypothetical protein